MNDILRIASVALILTVTMLGCADEVRPPDAAFGQTLLSGAPCSEAGTPTCAGEAAPELSLRDFQPDSESFEKIRTLSDYQGKTTVVALLAGW